MSATLRPYWRLFLAGVHEQSTYRLAMFGGLFANVVFGFLKAAMLLAAVRAAGGEVRGYDVGAMSAYVWLSQAMLGSVNLNGVSDFAERVKAGDVAVDFARPINPQTAMIARETGKAIFALGPRGLPSVAIGALVIGMSMPTTIAPYALGAVSLVLGILVANASVYVLATLSFWLIENRGVQVLYMVASSFFAGLFVPVGLLPGWLLTMAHTTPFPSMMMAPIDVLTGRVSGTDSLAVVGIQAFWLATMAALGALLTRLGRRKLEVQGG